MSRFPQETSRVARLGNMSSSSLVNSPHTLWNQFRRKKIALIQDALKSADGFLHCKQADQAPSEGCHTERAVFV